MNLPGSRNKGHAKNGYTVYEFCVDVACNKMYVFVVCVIKITYLLRNSGLNEVLNSFVAAT